MSEQKSIGFAGLSHLGIVYSTATIARGLPVMAFDSRPGLAAELSAGRFPVSEPGLEETAREHRSLVRYTNDIAEVAACATIFIALDVVTDDNNNSDLGPLNALLGQLAERAQPAATLVILSQVPPGFCRKFAARLRPDLNLFYQVETLVFGNAVERAIHPERYMVGCADPALDPPDSYRRFLEAFECPVLRMRYESAELCKIAINCFLVSSVSTTNTLAEVSASIGADWSEIAPALRLDRRIGAYAYLSPGLGIAGGNLERDLVTVQKLAAEYGCDSSVVTAWQQNSAYCRDWVLRRLFKLGLLEQREESTLALWGLAYKQDTHSTKNSPALALLDALGSSRWRAYDPVAKIDPAAFPSVALCGSALEAAHGATALVVMTPWKEFANVAPGGVREAMRGREILDPYGVLDGRFCRELGFQYHRLGA